MSSTIGNLPHGAPAQATDQIPIQRGTTQNFKLLVSDITALVPPTTLTWAGLTGDLTETQVIPWDGPTVGTKDTGISRLAAGSLAIGNGTAGDTTGELTMATITASSSSVTSFFGPGPYTTGNEWDGTPTVQIQAGTGLNPLEIHSANAVGIDLYTHAAAGFRAPVINFLKSRGTQASPTQISNGDDIGYLQFFAVDNSNTYSLGAQITCQSSVTWTTTDHSCEIVFTACPAGSITPTECFRMNSNSDAGGDNTCNSSALSIGFSSDVGIFWTAVGSGGGFQGTKDTGLSRISAGLIGVGTGAQGSHAGSLSMANLTVSGTTSFAAASIAVAALSADTIGLTDSTGLFTVTGSPATLGGSLTLSAFASQSQNYVLAGPATGGAGAAAFRALVAADIPNSTITPLWSNLGNAGANLTLANAGYTSTFNQTSAVNWTWANTTAAVLATNQSSPVINLGGTYFGGAAGALAASAVDNWSVQNVLAAPVQLSTTASITHISETAGNVVTLTLVASTFVPGQLVELSGFGTGFGDWLNGYTVSLTTATAVTCTFTDPTSHGLLASHVTTGTPVMTQVSGLSTLAFTHSGSGINSNVQLPSGTVLEWSTDTGISRLGAASLAIGNGTAGDITGSLSLAKITTVSTGLSVSITGVNSSTSTSAAILEVFGGTSAGNLLSLTSNSITIAYQCASGDGWFGTVTSNPFTIFTANGNGNIVTFASGGSSGSGTAIGNYNAADPGTDASGRCNLGITGHLEFAPSSTGAYDSGISRIGAASLAIGNGTAGDFTGNLSFNKVIKYAGVATVKAGIGSIVASTAVTGKTAAITATTIYAVPSSEAGMYKVSWTAWITTAAAASSTLGGTNGFQTVSTVGGVAVTDSPTTPTISALNTTATKISGVLICQCDASTNLQYAFGYTDATAVMTYSLNAYVEYLG